MILTPHCLPTCFIRGRGLKWGNVACWEECAQWSLQTEAWVMVVGISKGRCLLDTGAILHVPLADIIELYIVDAIALFSQPFALELLEILLCVA